MPPSRSQEFLDRLRNEILVADGATGTALYARGFSYRSCFEELNESQPEVVESLHREYLAAGAQVIETNTFGANPLRLAEHGFEKRVREINRAGALIARRAAGSRAFVAGSIGPLNRVLEPIGTLTLDDARSAFAQQVAGLLEGGVDCFVIETISSIAEMGAAIHAVRAQCDLPIVASMTFTEDGKTIVGDKPEQVRRALLNLGADVVGANCSVGPQPILDVIERMTGEGTVLSAMPNAGLPRVVGGRYLYLASPQYFAEYARRFIEAGVSLVGGCCGTTSDHVRAIAGAVKNLLPKRRRAIIVQEIEEEPAATDARSAMPFSDFRAGLGQRFMVSVEIDPPRSVNPEPFIHSARHLHANGINLINVADSPLARSRMSALAMAHLIRRDAGVEVLLHVSCRDRNALALQSELLGAHALGVINILAVTGDPPAIGDYPFAKGVFELDSIGLTRLINELNHGRDLIGRKIEEPASFLVGVGVNPTASDLATEYDRFRRKIEAGAEFAFTQPLFDVSVLEGFLNDVCGFCKIPIFLGILPLRSAKHAEFIHNEIPDMFVPESVRTVMRDSGADGARMGTEIARKFLDETKHLVQGVYLMPPFNKFEMALEVLKDVSLPQDLSGARSR